LFAVILLFYGYSKRIAKQKQKDSKRNGTQNSMPDATLYSTELFICELSS